MPPKDNSQNKEILAPKDEKDSKGVSYLIVPSAAGVIGGEQTEIAAQIIVPEEGGWGWVVMITSFTSICLVDGIIFTFGALFADIRDDLKVEESLVALINSVAFALYFTAGPVASAIINRYGFRECTMLGSIICMIALTLTYFSPNYIMVILFYGILNGFGACLINMASNLVVGFYFEKLRSLVLSISGSGSSAGVMIFYTVNGYITERAGWRVTTLLHTGLVGIIYFLGMTYRPLVSVFVTKTTEDVTHTVTHLPKLMEQPTKNLGTKTSVAERLFKTVSNHRYPTAASVVEEGEIRTTGPKPAAGTSTVKFSLSSRSALNTGQIKRLQSMVSSPKIKDAQVEILLEQKVRKKRKWWQVCCEWKDNTPESRPMYRDDAFFTGKVETLPEYVKSVVEVPAASRTGLEYQMAVTRTATAADLEEKRGVCTTAFKRIIVSMMDPKLLKRKSFILLCLSGFSTYLGFIVPYVFLAERNKQEGIDPDHCMMILSVIGLTNLVGRLLLGALACKLCPLKIYLTACLVSGLATIAFNFSFNVYYQYTIAIIYGTFIASLVSLRSMVLVKLYGIDMLTNATGIMVVFQGLGSLISTPLGSLVKQALGFHGTFYLAGFFVISSGLILIPVKMFANKENIREQQKNEKKVKL